MRQAISRVLKHRLFLPVVLSLLLAACSPSPEVLPSAAAATNTRPAPPTEPPAATEPSAASGMDVDHPASRSETITSADWEFTVVEVLRGEEGLAKLQDASAFNGPPEDQALEYVLVRVHVRYVGSATETQRVDPTFFDSAGSDGTLYDRPSIADVRNPEPVLQAELLPGEEAEGWVTVLSPEVDAGVMLVIRPRVNGLSTGQGDVRYILLGP